MQTPCVTVSFTQTFEGDESSRFLTWYDARSDHQSSLTERYNEELDCRVPSCHSALSVSPGGSSTVVVFHQTITGDAASHAMDRSRLEEFYSVQTDCRPPFCLASIYYLAASINIRVVLDIPDSPAGSDASNSSSTAATVKAAASALTAQPIAALSTMMNETVVSTSPPVISRLRRIDVGVVLSFPGSDTNATVVAVMAATHTLASRPSAITSLLNATLISTSPVVMAHAIVPLVVSSGPAPPPMIRTKTHPAAIAILISLLVAANFTILCACLWRKRHDAPRQELLAEAKTRLREREQGETELVHSEDAYRSSGTENANAKDETAEHMSAPLAEHAKERVREDRRSEAASRKHASSYVTEAREHV